MAKITIVDVARMASVSTATVSRAMHTPYMVRPSTLKKVQAVIEECGYVYNAVAGDFSRRKSSVIGVLIAASTPRIMDSVNAARDVAGERGYPLMICTSGLSAELERRHLQQFLQRGVAGVLIVGHMRENLEKIHVLQAHGIPCLFIWDTLPGTSENFVGFDNTEAFHNMMTYLISRGCRRIAFIGGISIEVERMAKRYRGYKKALEDHGLPFDETLVRDAAPVYSDGKTAAQSLLALPNPPDCICCSGDVTAMGAISAAHDAGLSVPGDVCITGFDNSDFTPYTIPSLTTMDVPGEAMGTLGMQALMELISEENHPPIQTHLTTSIVVRNSSLARSRAISL